MSPYKLLASAGGRTNHTAKSFQRRFFVSFYKKIAKQSPKETKMPTRHRAYKTKEARFTSSF